MRAAGRSSEDADWQRALDSGMLDLVRAGRIAEAKELLRSCLSIVVGLNHRTAPVELLERMTVPAVAAARRRSHDLAAREHLPRSSCSPRATAPRSTRARTQFHAGGRRRPRLPRRLLGRRPRRLRRPPLHVLRRRRGRAPLRGRRRPRLDDRRRERDPRPGPRGVAGRGARGRARPAALAHVPPRGRGRASGPRTETGIGRHPVSIPSAAVARRGRAARLARRPARARARRRRDGRGHGARARGRAASARSSSPTARSRAARSSRARVGGRAIPLDDIADALVDADVLLAVDRRRARCSSSAATIEMVMARRDGRALLVVDVAVPRDVDPGVGAGRSASRCSTSTTSRTFARAARSQQRRAEIGKVREILADELDRYRDRARRPRGRAARHRAARAGRGRPRGRARPLPGQARRARPRAARDAVEALTAGHRQQAAARADRAREGRAGSAARRALRRRARRRCSTSPMPDADRDSGTDD